MSAAPDPDPSDTASSTSQTLLKTTTTTSVSPPLASSLVYEDDSTRALREQVVAMQKRSLIIQARANSCNESDFYCRQSGGGVQLCYLDESISKPDNNSPPQTYRALFPHAATPPQRVNYTTPPSSTRTYQSIVRSQPSPVVVVIRGDDSSRPVRSGHLPKLCGCMHFDQFRNGQHGGESDDDTRLAHKMYCRSRSHEVLEYLKELSAEFIPTADQVKGIYEVLWEFENQSVKEYYNKVESAINFIRGKESHFRFHKVNYYAQVPPDHGPSDSIDGDLERANKLPDLLRMLEVFQAFESTPTSNSSASTPKHLPINSKLLHDCHKISESRRHPLGANIMMTTPRPSPRATPNSTPRMTPRPTPIALKPLDDVLDGFQRSEIKKTSRGNNKGIKTKKAAPIVFDGAIREAVNGKTKKRELMNAGGEGGGSSTRKVPTTPSKPPRKRAKNTATVATMDSKSKDEDLLADFSLLDSLQAGSPSASYGSSNNSGAASSDFMAAQQLPSRQLDYGYFTSPSSVTLESMVIAGLMVSPSPPQPEHSVLQKLGNNNLDLESHDYLNWLANSNWPPSILSTNTNAFGTEFGLNIQDSTPFVGNTQPFGTFG
ncbi:hypothetical protein BDR26DRAFT_870614 [Obelidium mucronatum]|nr:hypothetical protein BDR26DRAFT_870614 [Obelidium mucronatum]